MLYALAGLPRLCALKDLEAASTAIWRATGLPASRRRLEAALRELEDSFLTTSRAVSGSGTVHVVQVLNPSLIDFLQHRLTDDIEGAEAAFAAAPYFDQVHWLGSLLLDAGLLDEHLSDCLAAGALRTIDGHSPRRPEFTGGDLLMLDGRPAETDRPARLTAITRWVTATPSLRDPLRATVERVIARMIKGLEHAPIYSVSTEVALVGQLRAAGYAADGIVDRLKTMVMHDAASLSLFEVARDLLAWTL